MPGTPRRAQVAVALLLLTLGAGAAGAYAYDELRVAAAISLRAALESIGIDFRKETGTRLVPSFGSSGQLMAQLRNGAPIDVFLSAAHEQIDALENEGLVAPLGRRVFAGNRLVLIVPRNDGSTLHGFQQLADPAVGRVAIGSPGTVPAGLYARQTLETLHLLDPLQTRLTYGSNVRQVLDYVARGEVQAGIVYATDALADPQRVVIVATADPAWHRPIEYCAVVMKSSRRKPVGAEFMEYLNGPRTARRFERFGFCVPSGAEPRAAGTQPTSAPSGNEPPP